jgi:DNA-binding MarR family transcriptional regulator
MKSTATHTPEHVLARLSRAADAVREEVFAAFTRAGFGDVRPGHGCVFGTVGPEGSRVTDVALATGFTKQAVGEVVDDLEKLGYVERAQDPQDGRAKMIRLTDQGSDTHQVALDIFADIERGLAERYGAERVATMRELLEEIAAG